MKKWISTLLMVAVVFFTLSPIESIGEQIQKENYDDMCIQVDNPNTLWGVPFGIAIEEASQQLESAIGVKPNSEIPTRIQGLDFDVRIATTDYLYGIGNDGVFNSIELKNTLLARTRADIEYLKAYASQSLYKIYEMLFDKFGEPDTAYLNLPIDGDVLYFDIPYQSEQFNFVGIFDTLSTEGFTISYRWNNLTMNIGVVSSSASLFFLTTVRSQNIIYKDQGSRSDFYKGDLFKYLTQQNSGIKEF